MNIQLEQLLRLQGIDVELGKISDEQSAIPESMMAIEDGVREAEATCQQEKENLAALNKRRLSLENDLVLLNERLKKYQMQLLSAKTNQEYQAFLKEIELAKENISKSEEDILTLMDDGERMSADLSARDAELEKEKASSKREIESLRERLSLLSEQYKEKTAERKELAEMMDNRLLAKYERIKDGRGGNAVVVIETEVCAGCHTTLPPQFAAEVRKGDEVLACENCGRILVWKEAG
jgi:predicted  nucleic acid-binding Zn-ribbon protein